VDDAFSWKPWPNASYELQLDIHDRLNDTASATVDTAQVQIAPDLDPAFPRWVNQHLNDVDPQRFVNVSVPDYPGLAVEELVVNVTHEYNASKQEHLGRSTDQLNATLSFWNATDAPEDTTYNISAHARHGTAVTGNASWTVERPETNYRGDRPIAGESSPNKGVRT